MTETIEDVSIDHGVRPQRLVRGLDTLRFVTAMWVAFSHGARFPMDRVIQPDTAIHRLLLLLGKTTWNGTAAVTVFFLISGFLIHQGNVERRKVYPVSFWIRRGVRIGIPLVVIVLFTRALGLEYVRQLNEVLWSVYSEIIYYACYPLLLPLIVRFGIERVICVSLAISLAMIATNPSQIYLWAFGYKLTWLFNAPLWLMGCYLAERRRQISALSKKIPIWMLRCGAIFYCYASTILATHMGRIAIGYTWTIWLFGAFCMVWLDAEMSRGTGKSTLPLFERFGLAGYSLYLTHKIAITWIEASFGQLDALSHWIAVLIAVSALAWVFYRLVEWPAHKLARFLGRTSLAKIGTVWA